MSVRFAAGLLLAASMLISDALAGVSPENVVVVVNSQSQVSRTVANHYVQLRQIPSSNVIFLADVPSGLKTTLPVFKDQILTPLLNELNRRKIASQTRVIAYSADFPTAVDISPHTEKLVDDHQKKFQLPTASINGLTFLYQFVLADSEKYLDWGSNLYARGAFERHFANPFLDQPRRDRFEAAKAMMDEKDYGGAAEEYEKLLEEIPSLAPLAILAAQARAKNDDPEAAVELILQGIAAGWRSGTYLREDETLKSLLDHPRLTRASSYLSDLPTLVQEPLGFAGNVGWSASGQQVANTTDGIPYLMSCMLAVVHPRGSTLEQAIDILSRASQSDRTYPDAWFWFTSTKTVRTEPRFPGIAAALVWLQVQGHKADVIHQAMPNREGDCVGLMLGTPTMQLGNTLWKFVPGAIADNLTSASAMFETDGQTKITELLHAGAAMSSGPVFEPFNLPYKFPNAMMYGYYASGVAAIEAFYLSVTSPYQLLIVGDPLAQPFAMPPADWVGAQVRSAAGGKRQLRVTRHRLPVQTRQTDVGAIELFLEGKLIRRVPAASNIEMNLAGDLTGTIELRTVLVGNDPVRPRISHPQWMTLEGESPSPVARPLDDTGTVELRCEGADSITLLHHSEQVGQIDGGSGRIELAGKLLGDGPVRVRPAAKFGQRTILGQSVVVDLRSP